MANSSAGLTFVGQERTPSLSGAEADFAIEAGTPGGLFQVDYKRHDDLRSMLDSVKDNLKLEAMKRIIGMIAKGRDASDLFPAVVKNVVSKNIEVKKLVYVYLVRYAEEQQDLALLSISTFQRALKDPNQLIRASALRVLSSIRVPVIVPIMMLAIRESVSDMSPYVRKTAAHAIPKLFDLDPEQKDELVTVIEKLLSDQTTLVVGSAVMAFEQVCPERTDLIHKNYRKLCSILVDIEEWGQIVIIGMLTRYARTQFTDPNAGFTGMHEELKSLHKGRNDDGEDEQIDEGQDEPRAMERLDPDHQLLLRNTKPLLQSRNAAVVMAVVQLYHHLAPKNEVLVVAKALIRLLRSHREVQLIILNSIASLSVSRKEMFEPFLKTFFVRNTDATQIKLLKLEILTNMASEANISLVLREFQTYISSQDRELVAATIQAIGRCAAGISEVTDVCLGGLIALLSNADELIVAESVVVIKKLLQTTTMQGSHGEIVVQMARLVARITVPQARASILWLVGEHCEKKKVAKIAPDVLRLMAKTFSSEQNVVKLQILNLATKLIITNPKQAKILSQYVFSLAKYDQNYDIRDRARFLRHLVFPEDGHAGLAKYAKKIFLASKPAPIIVSIFKDRDEFQLGSLSHFLNNRAAGYIDLPAFPAVAPDPSVRIVESPRSAVSGSLSRRESNSVLFPVKRKESFYSRTSSEDENDKKRNGSSDSEPDSSSGTSLESGGESESEADSDASSQDDASIGSSNLTRAKPSFSPLNAIRPISHAGFSHKETSSESDSEYSSSNSSGESSESDATALSVSEGKGSSSAPKSNLDLLLSLDGLDESHVPQLPIMPSVQSFLDSTSELKPTAAAFVSTRPVELIPSVASGCNLQILYRYTRSTHLYSPSMVNIELTLTNSGAEDLADIHMITKSLPPGISIHQFPTLALLPAGSTQLVTIGIGFGDSTQSINFDVITSIRPIRVCLRPSVGELVRPVTCGEALFLEEQGKLKGMNEHSSTLVQCLEKDDLKVVSSKVLRAANLAQVTSQGAKILRFAGQTVASKSLVLVTVLIEESSRLTVNCEKIIIGSMLLAELRDALKED